MSNRIKELLDQRREKPATFANRIGIPTSTMYSITRGNTKFDNISIGVFMKIAHGLGMTAEELYYGEARRMEYADPLQEKLNGCFEVLNQESRETIAGVVASFAADPERRTVKDAPWSQDDAEPVEGAA